MEVPEIRKAQLSDLEKIMEIEAQSFREESFNIRQMRYLLKSENLFLVAENQQQLAAYMILLSKKNSAVLRIYALAVAEKFRGIGLAKRMLNNAIALANKRDLSKVSLEVKAVNYTAIKIYKSLGFKVVKELPAYYKDGTTALKMELSL